MSKVENVETMEEKVVMEEPVEEVAVDITESKKERTVKLVKKGLKIAGLVVAGVVTFGVVAAIVKGSKGTVENPIENVDYTVEK
jgi:hypothetical protein|nr:MAG TPA: hypothetical protein [Caudoviricetes sp.]